MWFRAYYLPTTIPASLVGRSVYAQKTDDGYTVFDGADVVMRHTEEEAKAYLKSYRTPAGKISVPVESEQDDIDRRFRMTMRLGSRVPSKVKTKVRRRSRFSRKKVA